jgi:hypothetical protein
LALLLFFVSLSLYSAHPALSLSLSLFSLNLSTIPPSLIPLSISPYLFSSLHPRPSFSPLGYAKTLNNLFKAQHLEVLILG